MSDESVSSTSKHTIFQMIHIRTPCLGHDDMLEDPKKTQKNCLIVLLVSSSKVILEDEKTSKNEFKIVHDLLVDVLRKKSNPR